MKKIFTSLVLFCLGLGLMAQIPVTRTQNYNIRIDNTDPAIILGEDTLRSGDGGVTTDYNELDNLPSIKDTVITYGVQLKDSTSYEAGGYETPTNVDNKILSIIGEGVEGVVLADSQTVFVTPTQLATELTGYTTTEALSDSLSALSIEGALMDEDTTVTIATVKQLTDSIAALRTYITNFELQFDQIYAALDELAAEDFTPPRFESAEIGDSANDLLIVVMDDADINPDSIPMSTDFTLTENGNAFGIDTLLISNDSIYITLDSTAMYGATYLLSYTRPVSGALQDTIGNKTASWVNKPVTNNVVPSDLLSGLIAYWKFDEESGNAIDATGNEFDITSFQNITQATTGIEYTASNSYVRLPFSQAFADSFSTTNAFSISMWVYLDQLPSELEREEKLIWWRHVAQTYFVNANMPTTDYVRLQVKDSELNTPYSRTANSTVTKGAWLHIVLIADQDEDIDIWLNGVKNTNIVASLDYSFLGSDTWFTIGGDGANAIDGKIKDVGIWNVSLTESKILEIYNSGNGLSYPFE